MQVLPTYNPTGFMVPWDSLHGRRAGALPMNTSARFDAFALLVISLMSIAAGVAAEDAARIAPTTQVAAAGPR